MRRRPRLFVIWTPLVRVPEPVVTVRPVGRSGCVSR